MSLEERGAHVTLLAWSWDNGPVPNDIKRIASILGVHKRIASRVIKHVFTRWVFEHDSWTNKRLEETRQKALNYSASRSYCGKQGGRPKAETKPYGKHMGKHTESPPISDLRSPTPDQDHQPRALALRAPTRELLARFSELHELKIASKARIIPGKDAKLLADLWRSHGSDVAELMTLFFAQNGDFVRGAGYTVGVFASQFGRLLTLRAELNGVIGPRGDEQPGRGAKVVQAFDRAAESLQRVQERRRHEHGSASAEGSVKTLGDPSSGKSGS